MLKKRNQIEKEEREKKRKEKEEKNKEKEKKIEESIDVTKEAKQKMCYKIFKDESIPSKEKTYRAIARKIRETFNEQTFSHLTAKKYIQEYEKKLNSKDINHMIGDGVLEEEVESNFGNSKQE
jgi:5,10-methylenetetrahydrofolate reductase